MNYFFGFSYFKHSFVKPFFIDITEIVFINPFFKSNYFKKAKKKGLNKSSNIYIWGKRSFPEVEEYALENDLKICRVEDGFIRSRGLGSDLTQPYSLVIDSNGIYFDPTQESDLESILNTTIFTSEMLNRAEKLKNYMLEKKLSKYNIYENKKLDISREKKIILVPGQVEDDASIQYGASGMTNLELLQKTRLNREDSYIIYKPHPDVLAGNRIGNIDTNRVLEYADEIVLKLGMDSVLDACDEVHTMTSFVGFEALIRDKSVYTYGMPFYAGWGLTTDFRICERRGRKLGIHELVAATLILYPKYIHPRSLEFCEAEELFTALDEEKKIYEASLFLRLKTQIRNFISRKSQLFLRIIQLKK